MLILGIETSTENASVGLVDTNGASWEINRHCHYDLSRELMGLIDHVLKDAQSNLSQIDAVAISIGPGSFTGLRVGLATAQGIAFSLNKPLIPVPTMDSLAVQITEYNHPVAVLQKARKGEVFYAQYKKSETAWKKVISEKVVTIDALHIEITSPCLLVGSAVEVYRDILVQQLKGLALFPAGKDIKASGKAIARCGLANPEKTVPPAAIEPLYIKEPDAKIKERIVHV
jgi:tRNA threonylcarbamoyladenosine biosynthesis protein TsaB